MTSLTSRQAMRDSIAAAHLMWPSHPPAEEDVMDEAAQAARAQALLRQLSPEQVGAMPHAVRQPRLAERREEAIQVVRGEVEMEGDQRREPLEAQLITMTAARDEARNGRALAEQLLVSLLRQLLPGQEPVYLFSLGVRELDVYGLNQVLARYRLRLRSRRRASERQVRTRVGERHWKGRSLFWLEPLLAGEGSVPELERTDSDNPSGPGEGV
jgi:hypothetical protein